MLLLDEPQPLTKWKPAYDRFIRSSCELKRRHGSCTWESNVEPTSKRIDDIVNKKLYSKSEETYRKLLAKALSVSVRAHEWVPTWPVRPRDNPCIHSPSAILDLPNVRDNYCSNLMDWSSTDYLTVAFPRSVYLWYAPKNTTIRFPVSHSTCIKWTQDGNALFTASRIGSFKLTNMEYPNDPYGIGKCMCRFSCNITCCSFHPFNDILLIGCSRGSYSLYHSKKCLKPLYHHPPELDLSITSVTFSCDGKHYAVANLRGTVSVYTLLYNKALLYIEMEGPTRAVAWHPWERSVLVVADCLGNMNVYKMIESQEPIASYASIYNSSIVCLTFNPITAELVVSHRLYGSIDDSNYYGTQINVLASCDQIVDRLEGHTGRVLCMCWSPDGSKIATSGSEETARIWKFLHPAQNRLIQKSVSNYTTSTTEIGQRLNIVLR